MNKKLLVGVFSAFMALTPWLGNAATQVTDAPHANLPDGCETCHFAGLEPGDCTTRCHQSDVSPYYDTVSPRANTHKDLKCQACHNPHVSLQDQGSVPAFKTGSFAGAEPYTGGLVGSVGYDATTGRTTLTGVTPMPEKRWAMKYGVIAADGTGIGKDRGMILWVANGVDVHPDPVTGLPVDVPQRASFEIKDIDVSDPLNYKVIVQGDATAITPGAFELQWGQLIAKKVTKDLTKGYLDGDRPVSFPPAGSTSRYVDTTAGSTPQGICQVCHVGTKLNGKPFTHWNGTGENKGHNADRDCEECHPHSAGFMVTECRKCHSGIGTGGAPTTLGNGADIPSEMASPATGSTVPGVHELHTGGRGGSAIVFPCEYCHTGSGMSLDTPDSIAQGDGIQIGFNVPGSYKGYRTEYKGQFGVTYQGTNRTKATPTGSAGNYTCSNVYCHSDGKSTRLGCATATPNTSPSWDTPMIDQGDGTYKTAPDADGTKCNNCHGFSKAYTDNRMVSNGHYNHVSVKNNIYCQHCHGDTAGPGISPALAVGTTKHVNGTIDVVGGGGYTVNYDPATKTCTTNCHGARSWVGTQPGYQGTQYTQYIDTATTCPDKCLELNDTPIMNADPVVMPYAYPTDSINTADATQAFVYANDPNTLHVKIKAYDPDNMDTVMNQCRKGSDPALPNKGGHYNGAGFIRTIFGNQCSTFNYDTVFPDTGWSDKELTCRYSDADLNLPQKNGKMCWTYAIADNDPASYNNMVANGWGAPAANLNDGLKAPFSSGPGEWACINARSNPAVMINDPMNNVVPEVTKTVTKVGKRIDITFTVKDADQVDSQKQAYWKAKYPTKTGGHVATQNHYVQINWSGEALTVEGSNPTVVNALQLNATGGSKTYSYDYDTYVGTSDGAANTTTTATVGTNKLRSNVWIQAVVCDNHVQGAEGNMTKDCYDTGWFNTLF